MPGMQAYVSFANPHQGWVLGSDFMPSQSSPEATAESLMVTSDGVHWQRKSIPGVASDFLGPIVLLDRLHGWIAVNELSGGYAILRTSDGGNTWQRVELNPLPMGDQVLALAFADRSHGWAVGGNEGGGGGIIFATTDGGVSWQRQLVTPAPCAVPTLPATAEAGRVATRRAADHERRRQNLATPGFRYHHDPRRHHLRRPPARLDSGKRSCRHPAPAHDRRAACDRRRRGDLAAAQDATGHGTGERELRQRQRRLAGRL